jgi:hypothetical protein
MTVYAAFTKTDNAPDGRLAKAELRRHVLAHITPSVVFDAYAGAGVMYDLVWRDADRYVGCDEVWANDARVCYVADNRRVLRAIDLAPFTIFDLDAFGNPWEQALIICARRPRLTPRERLGLIFTDGSWTKVRFKTGGPALLGHVAGMTKLPPGIGTLTVYDQMLNRAVQSIARRLGGTIVKQWRAHGSKGTNMRYIGIVVEGVPALTGPTTRSA